MEFITNAQIDRACKRQEKKNLKEKGSSLPATSMSNHLHPFIIEVRDDGCIMASDWRDFIKSFE